MEGSYEDATSGNSAGGSQAAQVTLTLWNNKPNSDSKKKKGKKKYLSEERHKSNGNPDFTQKKIAKWRMRDRMKTVSVALVYCLNIGVDPPDVIKTDPCARMECWIDPQIAAAQKALEAIGKALQAQYERWQPRARYKLSLDPTVDEVKKLCLSLRRNAKDERVLFHYNGHGVPKPTQNGEIWVFNKNYTQYIPLSIYELQTWMGSPSIYVFDCSAAGLIVSWFIQFAEQREREYERLATSNVGSSASSPPAVVPIRDFILLAACGSNELLPMNPDLPADVFTSCLTTPIKMALRWFCMNSPLAKQGINFDMIDKIPGRLTDRRTPIGELNWIFTAITDTIAWNVLPRDLFQKLFRQDLLVASLFRNFLLAERIMRSLNCTPISFPKLPSTYQHPMWQAWDLAVDMCLSQLPEIIDDPTIEYKFSPFFTDQLTAFEVWLEFGNEHKKPPEQLPIVLQVLLSQAHRLRALVLLGRFLDLGPWAVNLALSVGIFPYVLKLLQSPAMELNQILVFIWAKILALDKSCQLDLVKDNGHNYFINILSTMSSDSEQRTMSAFVLSVIANNCRPGQSACLNGNLLQICLSQLNDPDPMVRRWVVLCLGKLWESFEEAKWAAVRENAHDKLCALVNDQVPEVRAAVIYALGTFIGGASGSEQRTTIELSLGLMLSVVTSDVSPIVRKELIIAYAKLIKSYESQVRDVASELIAEEKSNFDSLKKRSKGKQKSVDLDRDLSPNNNSSQSLPTTSSSSQQSSVYACLWKVILQLSSDPFPELARMADSVVRAVTDPLIASMGGLGSYNSMNSLNLSGLPSLSSSTGSLPPGSAGGNSGTSNNNSLSGSVPPSPGSKLKKSSGKIKLMSQFKSSTNLSKLNLGLSGGTSSSNMPSPNTSSGLLKKTTSVDFSKLEGGSLDDDSLISQQQLQQQQSSPEELQSNFYEWGCEYFSKPLLSLKDEDEEGSPAWVEKKWRHQRNETVLAEARSIHQNYSTSTLSNRFDEQVAIVDNSPDSTSSLLFHAFDPVVVIADDKDGVSIWDREFCQKIHSFRNRSPTDFPLISRTTGMCFINEHDVPLLLLGSDDGTVRLWSGYDDPDRFGLTSSWKALHGLTPGVRGASGLQINWQQETGLLLTSGDITSIRVWDLDKELLVDEMNSGSDACVTSMTNNNTNTRSLVSGYGDGSIRIFDYRTKYGYLATLSDHRDWVVNVHIPKTDPYKLISASVDGQIKFWDIREVSSNKDSNPKPIKSINAHSRGVLTALAVHDYAPVLASGSQKQKVKVYNFNGDELSLIRYHDGFLGQRIGPVSCLSFHPYLMLLAVGATDSIVSLYTKR